MDKDIRSEFLKINKPFLTAKDISELLGITLNHVYVLAANKKIPSQKIGKYRRFRALDMLVWIENKGGRL